jgi:hypothetical protein
MNSLYILKKNLNKFLTINKWKHFSERCSKLHYNNEINFTYITYK